MYINEDKCLLKMLTYQVIGEIKAYAGVTPPTGWMLCNGQEISRSDYQALFNAIGTTYGSGDGSTTFNLPDLSGRVPIGVSSTHSLGSSGGSEDIQAHTHAFTQPTIPNHQHDMGQLWSDGTGSSSAYMMTSKRKLIHRYTTSSGGGGACTGGAVGAVSGAATGNAGNMQPYLTINYIIYVGD